MAASPPPRRHFPFMAAGRFIPTPYPISDTSWDFSCPLGERRGIFVGTREWDVPSRATILPPSFAAVGFWTNRSHSSTKNQSVVTSSRPPSASRAIRCVILGPRYFPYRDYLAEMARHKIVLQADNKQRAGTSGGRRPALPYARVGGDGAVDRLAFPAHLRIWPFVRRTAGAGRALAARSRLFTRRSSRNRSTGRSGSGFAVVARQLADFFANCRAGAPPARVIAVSPPNRRDPQARQGALALQFDRFAINFFQHPNLRLCSNFTATASAPACARRARTAGGSSIPSNSPPAPPDRARRPGRRSPHLRSPRGCRHDGRKNRQAARHRFEHRVRDAFLVSVRA